MITSKGLRFPLHNEMISSSSADIQVHLRKLEYGEKVIFFL